MEIRVIELNHYNEHTDQLESATVRIPENQIIHFKEELESLYRSRHEEINNVQEKIRKNYVAIREIKEDNPNVCSDDVHFIKNKNGDTITHIYKYIQGDTKYQGELFNTTIQQMAHKALHHLKLFEYTEAITRYEMDKLGQLTTIK